jgi:hypothetical protein
MALVRGKVNALALLGMRKLKRMPPNFAKITLRDLDHHSVKIVELWILQNLDSRFCIRKNTGLIDDNKMTTVYEVGFEEPKELTMFSLGCPTLHNRR